MTLTMRYLALFFLVLLGGTGTQADSLKLVQLLHRHGDRSPDKPITNDVNNPYWLTITNGYGQLTNTGKNQLYDLGQYLRERWGGFINSSYGHQEIIINSTDKDRTLQSAYCNLAGFFPPSGDQVWDDSIDWQPIPVHTRPIPNDHIVSPDSECPKFDELFNIVKVSSELQQINIDNAELYATVANYTKMIVTDIFNLYDVTDALVCDMAHNLSIPSWVAPLWDQMLYLYELSFYYEYSLPQLARLRAGPLLGVIIDNMKLASNNQLNGRKALFYSSHDTMVTPFLSILGIDNYIPPPYACSVLVELWSLDAGGFGVEIYYRNDSQVDPYHMQLPNCSSPCPLDQLILNTRDMIPADIVSECYLVQKPITWLDRFRNYFGF